MAEQEGNEGLLTLRSSYAPGSQGEDQSEKTLFCVIV
jgi:hypothetical protein